MSAALDEVLDLLNLETLEVNLFRGRSPATRTQRVFGGQVIGQALVAANRTVKNRFCHSMHAYFIRPGDPKVPIIYEVDHSRDGKSFTTRRVVAIQHGRQIFVLNCSFQKLEGGLTHQIEMPDIPAPEDLKSEHEILLEIQDQIPEEIAKRVLQERPIEIRPVNPQAPLNPKKMEPYQHVWIKAADTLPDDNQLHQCLTGYASDMKLLDTCTLPHGVNWWAGKLQVASLDHSMWFHNPFRADEWLLYTMDSPASGGARGLNRGSIYTREGELVCSVAQEGLIRLHD